MVSPKWPAHLRFRTFFQQVRPLPSGLQDFYCSWSVEPPLPPSFDCSLNYRIMLLLRISWRGLDHLRFAAAAPDPRLPAPFTTVSIAAMATVTTRPGVFFVSRSCGGSGGGLVGCLWFSSAVSRREDHPCALVERLVVHVNSQAGQDIVADAVHNV